MIRFPCPHCSEMLKADDQASGRKGRCKHCRKDITVPALARPEPIEPPRTVEPSEILFPEQPQPFESLIVRSTYRPADSPERLVWKKWKRRLFRRQTAAILLVAVLSTGLAIGAAAFLRSEPVDPEIARESAEKERIEDWKRAAWTEAKTAVAKCLLAPKAAEFPEEGTVEVTFNHPDGKDVRFEVTSHVDAKNAFGVPLRKEWVTTLRVAKETNVWSIDSIKIDGKFAYLSPEIMAVAEKLQTIIDATPAKFSTSHEWRGRGNKNTDVFRISNSPWRLNWSLTSGNSLLQVFVYRDDGTLQSTAVNQLERGNGDTLIHEAGRFRLEINAVGSWKLSIDEQD